MKPSVVEFFRAVKKCLDAIGFISKHGLAHYFLFPILFSIVLSMGAFVLIKQLVDYAMHPLHQYISYTPLDGSFWENTKSMTSNIGMYATSFFIFILGWYLFSKMKKYLVLALMSPILALLSERAEKKLTGSDYRFSFKKLIMDIARGVALAFRNFILETILTSVVWIASIYLSIIMPYLSFIIAPALAILTFFIGAYFFGFSAIDYCSERKNMTWREGVNYVRKHRYSALGNGAVLSVLFMIPFVGVTMGTIICTVGAVLSVHDIDKTKSLAK
jgi:CysZ protein